MSEIDLKAFIRDIKDFPKEGVVFKDITPLLKDKGAFEKAINLFAERFQSENVKHIVSVEARGFIFGAALAYRLGAGFIPVRKKGKLPHKTSRVTYELEYGTDTLEHHEDAFDSKDRVLVIDDVLATGGTVKAVCDLIQKKDVDIVGLAFLMELDFLKGREKLSDWPIYSILRF